MVVSELLSMRAPPVLMLIDRDFVELFCGKMEVSHALRRAGLRGTSLDVELDPQTMDFLKPAGFWSYTRTFGEFLAGAFMHLRSEPFIPQNHGPGMASHMLRKSDYELFVQANVLQMVGLRGSMGGKKTPAADSPEVADVMAMLQSKGLLNKRGAEPEAAAAEEPASEAESEGPFVEWPPEKPIGPFLEVGLDVMVEWPNLDNVWKACKESDREFYKNLKYEELLQMMEVALGPRPTHVLTPVEVPDDVGEERHPGPVLEDSSLKKQQEQSEEEGEDEDDEEQEEEECEDEEEEEQEDSTEPNPKPKLNDWNGTPSPATKENPRPATKENALTESPKVKPTDLSAKFNHVQRSNSERLVSASQAGTDSDLRSLVTSMQSEITRLKALLDAKPPAATASAEPEPEQEEGSEFPEMTKMWNGTKEEQHAVFAKWLEKEMNMGNTEAQLIITKSKSAEVKSGYEELTVAEMVKRGFSKELKKEYNAANICYDLPKDHSLRVEMEKHKGDLENQMDTLKEVDDDGAEDFLEDSKAMVRRLLSYEMNWIGRHSALSLRHCLLAKTIGRGYASVKHAAEIGGALDRAESKDFMSELQSRGCLWIARFHRLLQWPVVVILICWWLTGIWFPATGNVFFASDEATAVNEQWMFLMFTSDLHPAPEVIRLHFFVAGFRGDWKALRQAFNFNRYADRDKICWMCEATKGAEDETYVFTNLHTAPYMETFLAEEPWTLRPAYHSLAGFHVSLIFPDILHAYHLGCGRDLLGSALFEMVAAGYFGAGTIPARLAEATRRLKLYAKTNKLNLRLKKLTKTKLNWSTAKYPELKSSGFDTYIVQQWVLHEISSVRDPGLDGNLVLALWASNHCISLWSNAGRRWLTSGEVQTVQKCGMVYMKCYIALAEKALREQQRLYR
ncbi:unnamed protein product, partial [Symbiodinium necroappetens]